MTETKYCIDCLHSRESSLSLMRCAHPNLGKSLDTGHQKAEGCISLRRDNIFLEKTCGEDAKWFEPKEESIVTKLKFNLWKFLTEPTTESRGP